MKLALKLLAGLLGLVVLALILVIAAVALFVDPNDYRDEIAGAVQAQTGRELAIEGELSLSLLPCCAISLGETRLSNPPGFEQASFARVESARLGVRVWPLLTRRELLLDQVELVGLQADLVRLEDGRANWDFATDEASPAASPPDEAADPGEPGLAALSVGGIRIADARVSLRDAAAGTDVVVDKLDLATGELAPGEPFDFDGSLHFIDRVSGLEADLALAAAAVLDTEAARLALEALDGRISGRSDDTGDFEVSLRAPAAAVDLSGEVVASVQKPAVELELRGGALGDDGSLSLAITAPQLGFDQRLALDQPELVLQARTPALPGGAASGRVSLRELDYAVDSGVVGLRALDGQLELAGADLRLAGDGTFGEGANRLSGDFELGRLSPRDLLAKLDQPVPDTADATVLTRLDARGAWRLDGDRLALERLAVQLDDSKLTGTLSLRDFEQPKLRFELGVDALDLDRYLAPEDEAGAAAGGAADGEEETDLEALRRLDIEGGLEVGTLTVSNLLIEDLAARVTVRNGVLRLDPASARLYDGKYSGSVIIDASGPELRLELDQTLEGVQARGLLGDFAEVEQIEGAMAARIRASGSGAGQDELLRNLEGDLSFDLSDGIYQGMDLWHEIRRARALIRRKPPPARSGENQTVINTLTLQGRLEDGVLRSRRMQAEIPFLRLTGDGALDVLARELDYRFEARVFETPTFADGERYEDLTGLTIPVTISGPAAKPQIGVDLAALATNVAVQKATDKLFERLGIGEREQEPPAADTEQGEAGDQAAPETEQQQEQKPRDMLRESLRDLLRR